MTSCSSQGRGHRDRAHGPGLSMKIQAKDCAQGGIFQMEPARGDGTVTDITHALATDPSDPTMTVFYFDNPNFQPGNFPPLPLCPAGGPFTPECYPVPVRPRSTSLTTSRRSLSAGIARKWRRGSTSSAASQRGEWPAVAGWGWCSARTRSRSRPGHNLRRELPSAGPGQRQVPGARLPVPSPTASRVTPQFP